MEQGDILDEYFSICDVLWSETEQNMGERSALIRTVYPLLSDPTEAKQVVSRKFIMLPLISN